MLKQAMQKILACFQLLVLVKPLAYMTLLLFNLFCEALVILQGKIDQPSSSRTFLKSFWGLIRK
ncbi:hypothetical protein BDV12DRAFT_173554 [Aspergillus spectabilis]